MYVCIVNECSIMYYNHKQKYYRDFLNSSTWASGKVF